MSNKWTKETWTQAVYTRYTRMRNAWLCKHNLEDAQNTWELAKWEKPRLQEQGLLKWFLDVEMDVIKAVLEGELRGVPVNVWLLKEAEDYFNQKVIELTNLLEEKTWKGFNANSGREVAKAIFGERQEIRTPLAWTKGSKRHNYEDKIPKTDKSVLKYWESKGVEVCKLIRESKEWDKLLQFVQSLKDQIVGTRLYLDFNTYGTETGRLSGALQNIPKKHPDAWRLRQAIEGKLIGGDMSQGELRTMAARSGCKELIEVFKQPTKLPNGEPNPAADPHLHRANKQGISREEAKTKNYADAYKLSDEFLNLFPEIRYHITKLIGDWIWTTSEYKDTTYTKRAYKQRYGTLYTDGYVTSISGRRRRFPEYRYDAEHPDEKYWDSNKNREARLASRAAAAEREAVNFAIGQGTLTDVIKLGTSLVYRSGLPITLLLNYHDELWYEINQDIPQLAERLQCKLLEPFEKELQGIMEIEIKKARNWREGKE